MSDPLKPMESTGFGGTAKTLGFEFRITPYNKPQLDIDLKAGETFVVQRSAEADRPRTSVSERSGTGNGEGGGVANPKTIFQALNRKIGGERFLVTKFKNESANAQRVTLTAPKQGDIVAVNLDEAGGTIYCKKGSFMAAPAGTKVSWWFNWRAPLSAWFGFGEGAVLYQKIQAPHGFRRSAGSPTRNWAFLHSPGTVSVKDIVAGDSQVVTRGRLLARSAPSVSESFAFTKTGFGQNLLNVVMNVGSAVSQGGRFLRGGLSLAFCGAAALSLGARVLGIDTPLTELISNTRYFSVDQARSAEILIAVPVFLLAGKVLLTSGASPARDSKSTIFSPKFSEKAGPGAPRLWTTNMSMNP